MQVTALELDGLRLLQLSVHSDERGFFVERFNRQEFAAHGLPTAFVQDNHSRSHPGVLRGLHFQLAPSQGKLVGVVRGRIWDVAVDIRTGSVTRGRWYATELSDDNGRLLWIPAGFAHGFCVLGNQSADLIYKVDQPYQPAGEGGIHFADADLAIPWPIDNPIVSARDRALPTWSHVSQTL